MASLPCSQVTWDNLRIFMPIYKIDYNGSKDFGRFQQGDRQGSFESKSMMVLVVAKRRKEDEKEAEGNEYCNAL